MARVSQHLDWFRVVLLAIPAVVFWSVWLPAQDTGFPELGTEIVRLVRDHFYNKDQAEAWAGKHAEYARELTSRTQFIDQTKKILAELNASHTGYYTSEDTAYYAIRAIFNELSGPDYEDRRVESIGINISPDGFVRTIFVGSPAAETDLQRGDRIVLCDDQPFQPINSIKGKEGQRVRLTIQKTQDGPTSTLDLQVRLIDPIEEWLYHLVDGTRIIKTTEGRRSLYVPYYCGAGERFTEAFENIIQEKQDSADLMILDARSGWGGSPPNLIARFDRAVPALEMRQRDKITQLQSSWRKPIIVLVDGGTRSGKEVFAWAIQKHHRGRLIGQKTAGAVVGGTPYTLKDGSLLFLAVADIRVDGQRLEGIGVVPDITVPEDLAYSQGRDRTLEAAIQEADLILQKQTPLGQEP